jgi:hypothetical protein
VVQPCEFNDDISQIDIGYGQIRVGQYIGLKTNNSEYGWYLDADTVLPINGLACDYVGTIRHELGHALGITCERDTNVTINSEDSPIIPVELGTRGNGWLKFSKSWSRMSDGTTSGHGSTMTIGADRAVRDNWKLGGFFSYGTRTFSGTGSNLQNSDYRLGIYGIRNKGAHEAFVYADVGRQHNDGKRISLLRTVIRRTAITRAASWNRRPVQLRSRLWQGRLA